MSATLHLISVLMAFWLGGWMVLTTQRLKDSPDETITAQAIFQAMAWPWYVAKYWTGHDIS